MIDFLDADKGQAEAFFLSLGEKRFRADQVRLWLLRGASDFSEMTDLPKALREYLREAAEKGEVSSGTLRVLELQSSKDRSTEKFLLELSDGNAIETVLMRYKYGNSVCVSSQAGCRMGCAFCASTIGGLQRNLTAGEMTAQVTAALRRAKEASGLPISSPRERIGHIVIMGTGEPFDNYENVKRFIRTVSDPAGLDIGLRNITVSTCGIVPMIERFTEELPQVNLAISLHAPNNAVRDSLMPVNRRYPIEQLMAACEAHARKTGRRVTFEYALAADTNDAGRQAEELTMLLRRHFCEKLGTAGLCHVNLIPLNKVEETGMEGSDRATAEHFRDDLLARGIPATIRREMGADIDAACGQLRLNKNKEANAGI